MSEQVRAVVDVVMRMRAGGTPFDDPAFCGLFRSAERANAE